MSGMKVILKSDNSNVTDNMELQNRDASCSEEIGINIEMSDSEDNSRVYSRDGLHQTEHSTKLSGTDSPKNQKLNNIQYKQLDGSAVVGIREHLYNWNMTGIILFSVISDSECDIDARQMLHEPNDSVQNIRKMICNSLVEAAAVMNAAVITCGLNKGVDYLIGCEVKQRLSNQDMVPKFIFGISSRNCIAKKKSQLNDSQGQNEDQSQFVPTVLSLSEHHTHLLLIDGGTQMKSDIQQMVQFELMECATHGACQSYETHGRSGAPNGRGRRLLEPDEPAIATPLGVVLIYVLVGGGINAFRMVKLALDNNLPYIIAVGTGGAADIISKALSCKDGVLEYLPEIAEKLITRLEELLIADGILTTIVRKVITEIKAELNLLLEIIVLLSQIRITNGGEKQFKDEITKLKRKTTNRPLAGIADLLISQEVPFCSGNQLAANDDSDTVDQMCVAIEQILVANGIPQEKAMQTISRLEHGILDEVLATIKFVFSNMNAIQTHDRKDLLIKFDISKDKKTILSIIDEALKKGEIFRLGKKCLECGEYHTEQDRNTFETKLKRTADDPTVVEFIKKTFKKRECNRFQCSTNQHESEICECGYSKDVHSKEALQNEYNQSKSSTNTFPTDAFGKLECAEDVEDFDRKAVPKSIRYVRLDHKTDVHTITSFLKDTWDMGVPDVIFSVISGSDFYSDASKGHDAIETKRNESIQHIRKTTCSNFIKTVPSRNTLIVTGGLNKGVDQHIGNEVNQRLANGAKIPAAVLGICNWGCLAKKKFLLNDSLGSDCCSFYCNPTGMWLNQNHTHFLLVDDGTQRKSGCEYQLREKVELTLAKEYYSEHQSRPLIYLVIGGNIDALNFVERALANGNPVIIAMGTGGAADIISGEIERGLVLESLPEIFENLLNRLEESLTAGATSENKVRQVIAKIKRKTKIDLFLKIVELLDKTRVSRINAQSFRKEMANFKKKTTNELLAEIEGVISSRQATPSDECKHSALSTKSDTVNRMLDVIEQMLIVNGIPQGKAKQAVDDLDKDVLGEALANIRKILATDLDAIRKHEKLIKLNHKSRQKDTVIVEALMKVKRHEPVDLYHLFVTWDNKKFFKQLILENWMRHEHEQVLKLLLNSERRNVKLYVKLMMEHMGNCNFLTNPGGPLDGDFRDIDSCKKLQEQLHDLGNTANKRLTIRAKMLFIWCVQNHMPETAMLFWVQGQDCLAMAVLAYRMSKQQKDRMKNSGNEDMEQQQSMSNKPEEHEERSKSAEKPTQSDKSKKQEDHVNRAKYKEIEHQLQFFEKVALEFVSKCHMDSKYFTYDLLSYEVEDLDKQTTLKIAFKAKFGAFFYSDLLSNLWREDVETDSKHKHIPLMLSVACPLLAPKLLEIYPDYDEFEWVEDRLPGACWDFVNYSREVTTFLRAPFVKFYYSFISYIGYLILFSIVMLTDFRGKISPSEIGLVIWTCILTIEEIRQFIGDRADYKSNEWNYFDIGALTLYITGFTLRMIYHRDPTICPECLYVARIILAFSLLIFFGRTLQFLSAYESLGPKIYMLYGLVADLFGFLLILGVFVSAYGVVSNVILYPNQPLNATLLSDVFYDSWWSVIQQFNREDALGLNCNMNNASALITAEYCSSTSDDNIDYVLCKENRCPSHKWIVSVLLAFYALLTCIMLLNLLIAMFNSTFTTIDEKEKEVSNIQRYRLISEFRSHSMIPPPLCVVTYPYLIIKHVANQCKSTAKCRCATDGNNSEDSVSTLDDAIKDWECSLAAEYFKENHEGSYETRIFPESTEEF